MYFLGIVLRAPDHRWTGGPRPLLTVSPYYSKKPNVKLASMQRHCAGLTLDQRQI